MPKICYAEKRFKPATLATIERAETICVEYAAQGFSLTLRQLYYQFVARGLIANNQAEYKRLGAIVNDARLAGLLDWSWLEDRTRNVRELSHWSSPTEIMRAVGSQYRIDRWARQPNRPIVLIEKDALIGVIERVCESLDVAYFSCRGYTSQSEMWAMAQRLKGWIDNDQIPVILHLGDHDPSGIDMSRDIRDRLNLFVGAEAEDRFGEPIEIRRLALTIEQVEQWDPPPNPAKETDARFIGYRDVYGDESWELDALDPATLSGLVRDAVTDLRINRLWWDAEDEENAERDVLARAAARWDDVATFVRTLDA